MNSMTGYAYKEVIDSDLQISVEMKSVNSRFLDLSVNMPSFMSPIESRIRALVGEKIVRGKIDLTIRLHDNAPALCKSYVYMKLQFSALNRAEINFLNLPWLAQVKEILPYLPTIFSERPIFYFFAFSTR